MVMAENGSVICHAGFMPFCNPIRQRDRNPIQHWALIYDGVWNCNIPSPLCFISQILNCITMQYLVGHNMEFLFRGRTSSGVHKYCFNPNWYELREKENCSYLAPPRSTFYKTQWAWQGIKLTRFSPPKEFGNFWYKLSWQNKIKTYKGVESTLPHAN